MIRAALATWLVLGLVAPARADKAAADALANEATAAVAAGDFKQAAAKFTAAFKEDPSRPELFCNIGITLYKADDLPRAHLLLNRCLERTAQDNAFVETVRTALTAIEATMRTGNYTRVTFNVDRGTTVGIKEFGGDEATFTGTRTVWLGFGTFHATGQAEGYSDKTIEVVVDKPTPQEIWIKLDKPGSQTANPPIKPIAARSSPALPIVTTGVTVVAGILLFVAHGKAKDIEKVAPFALSQDVFDNDKSDVKTWNGVIGASATVVVLGAAASTYLWIRFARHEEPPLEVAPAPGGASVSFKTRF